MRLLLASKSPRRRQLLSELGFPVEFVDLDVHEHVDAGTPADTIAELLARRKAEAFQWAGDNTQSVKQPDNQTVLIAADTVVVHKDRVLGKPSDRDDAVAMLRNLSGDTHQVYTGVCLRTHKETLSFTERTDVTFMTLTDEEINYYIDHYRPYDKAGAYGIQEWIGMVGISGIQGCYYNVMGLPVARLFEELKKIAG